MKRIVFSEPSRSDLREIWTYIAIDSPGTAGRLYPELLLLPGTAFISRASITLRFRPEIAPAPRKFPAGRFGKQPTEGVLRGEHIVETGIVQRSCQKRYRWRVPAFSKSPQRVLPLHACNGIAIPVIGGAAEFSESCWVTAFGQPLERHVIVVFCCLSRL